MNPRRPVTTEIRDIRLAQGIDVVLSTHGARYYLHPTKLRAEAWLQCHAALGAQWSGGALAVPPAMIEALVRGLLSSGFVVR